MVLIFNRFLLILWIVFVLWFVLMSLHFTWGIIAPEGIIGIWMAIRILGLVVLTGVQFIAVIVVVVMSWKSEESKIILIALPFGLLVLNAIQFSPELLFRKAVVERFHTIRRVEDLIADFKFKEAREYGDELIEVAESKFEAPPKYLLFDYLYYNSNKGTKRRYYSLFEAYRAQGHCLSAIGLDSKLAEEYLLKSIAINRENLGNSFNRSFGPLLDLVDLNISLERYDKVDLYFSDLIQSASAIDDQKLLKMSITYLMYSRVVERKGDFGRAAEIRKKAYELVDLRSINDDEQQLMVSFMKVIDHIKMNELSEAEDILADIKSERRWPWSWSGVEYHGYLGLETEVLRRTGKLLEADAQCKKFIEEAIERDGTDGYYHAQALVLQSKIGISLSHFEEASQAIEKSVNILATFQPNYEQEYILANLNLALCQFHLGKYDLSLSGINFVDSLLRNSLSSRVYSQTTIEKEEALIRFSSYYKTINSIIMNIKPDGYEQKLLDNVLLLKGAGISSRLKLTEVVNKNSELKSDFQKLDSAKLLIERLKAKNIISEALLTQELENRSFERAINQSFLNDLEFSNGFSTQKGSWKKIQSVLREEDAVVEYFSSIKDLGAEKRLAYWALIVTRSMENPVLVALFDEDSLIAQHSINLPLKERIATAYSERNSLALAEMIWDPIEVHVSHAERIFVSKSGILNAISYQALPIKENERIINLFSSTVLLDTVVLKDKIPDSVFLIGNVDYSGSVVDSVETRFSLDDLTFSKVEIEEIAEILQTQEIPFSVLSGSNAKESSVKDLISLKSNSIVHIASHGFYIRPNDVYNIEAVLDGEFSLNPMLRSGLVFADYNQSDESSRDDGIMTALEVASLDLSNVDLVVLSACESGLGDILGDEGVFGLQRAFRIAGAKAQLISLWKIPDKETSLLMINFYENYLAGHSPEVALYKAQQTVKIDRPSPFYWAGFTVVR